MLALLDENVEIARAARYLAEQAPDENGKPADFRDHVEKEHADFFDEYRRALDVSH
jgi:hypothetical protein